jgi:hypothetical protein
MRRRFKKNDKKRKRIFKAILFFKKNFGTAKRF